MGLFGGEHFLYVAIVEPGGWRVADQEFDFVADPTPPKTIVHGANELTFDESRPWRPHFKVGIEEDGYGAADHAECSLTPLHAAPSWDRCKPFAAGATYGGTYSAQLPHKRRDYSFKARAVDDLGRRDPTPGAIDFNPVPCAARARKVSLGKLRSRGLPVRVRCAFSRVAHVRFAYDDSTLFENTPLGSENFTGKGDHWTARGRVRLTHGAARFVGHRRRLPIGVIATNRRDGGMAGFGVPGVAHLTLHR